MIYQNLYYETLIRPCEEGADLLRIISGYATSTMALQHLEDLRKKNLNVTVSLLVGMCPTDGLAVSNHKGFQDITVSENYKEKFSCSYIYKLPSVHTKLYIWYKDKKLYKSFTGSANYTYNAFFHQRESLAEIRDENVTDYYHLLEEEAKTQTGTPMKHISNYRQMYIKVTFSRPNLSISGLLPMIQNNLSALGQKRMMPGRLFTRR